MVLEDLYRLFEEKDYTALSRVSIIQYYFAMKNAFSRINLPRAVKIHQQLPSI